MDQPAAIQARKTVIPPYPGEPELRAHEGHERLHVLATRVRLLLADHDRTLGPGEAAEFDTRVPHSFGSAGDQRVEVSASRRAG